MGWKYRAPALLLLLGSASSAWAALDPDESVFRDKKLGLTLQVPDGWVPSTQTGYPSIRLLLLEPGGASLSLSAGSLAPRVTLDQHVSDSNQGLRKAGLLVLATRSTVMGSRSVIQVTARREDGARELRQVYLAQGARIFVLTLCAPPARIAALLPELQGLVRGLEIR